MKSSLSDQNRKHCATVKNTRNPDINVIISDSSNLSSYGATRSFTATVCSSTLAVSPPLTEQSALTSAVMRDDDASQKTHKKSSISSNRQSLILSNMLYCDNCKLNGNLSASNKMGLAVTSSNAQKPNLLNNGCSKEHINLGDVGSINFRTGSFTYKSRQRQSNPNFSINMMINQAEEDLSTTSFALHDGGGKSTSNRNEHTEKLHTSMIVEKTSTNLMISPSSSSSSLNCGSSQISLSATGSSPNSSSSSFTTALGGDEIDVNPIKSTKVSSNMEGEVILANEIIGELNPIYDTFMSELDQLEKKDSGLAGLEQRKSSNSKIRKQSALCNLCNQQLYIYSEKLMRKGTRDEHIQKKEKLPKDRRGSKNSSSIKKKTDSFNRNQPFRWSSMIRSRPRSPSLSNIRFSDMSVRQVQILKKYATIRLTSVVQNQNEWSAPRRGFSWKFPKLSIGSQRRSDKSSSELQFKTVFGGQLEWWVGKTGKQLPNAIWNGIHYLIRNCGHLHGLFRRVGNKSQIENLKERIEVNPDFNNFDEYHGFVIADVVKTYFRQLPEPLIVPKLSNMLLTIFQQPQAEELEIIRLALLILPDVNRNALVFFLSFLKLISENSHINEMNASNLAVCLAPSIFSFSNFPASSRQSSVKKRSASRLSSATPRKHMGELNAANYCLKIMIEYINELPEITEYTFNKTQAQFETRGATSIERLFGNEQLNPADWINDRVLFLISNCFSNNFTSLINKMLSSPNKISAAGLGLAPNPSAYKQNWTLLSKHTMKNLFDCHQIPNSNNLQIYYSKCKNVDLFRRSSNFDGNGSGSSSSVESNLFPIWKIVFEVNSDHFSLCNAIENYRERVDQDIVYASSTDLTSNCAYQCFYKIQPNCENLARSSDRTSIIKYHLIQSRIKMSQLCTDFNLQLDATATTLNSNQLTRFHQSSAVICESVDMDDHLKQIIASKKREFCRSVPSMNSTNNIEPDASMTNAGNANTETAKSHSISLERDYVAATYSNQTRSRNEASVDVDYYLIEPINKESSSKANCCCRVTWLSKIDLKGYSFQWYHQQWPHYIMRRIKDFQNVFEKN